MNSAIRHRVTVYEHGGATVSEAMRSIVEESALVIGVNGTAEYTIMRTPGHDRELATGFLFTEGIVNTLDDVTMLKECPDSPHVVTVETATPVAATVSRNLVVNSSCGLCGRVDLEALLVTLGRVGDGITVPHTVVHGIPRQVAAAQILFRDTGATHAAALFDETGTIFVVREDVGRHNAVDKVIGAALLWGAATASMGIFLSGRASLELIVKAARAGISLVVSVSAPTQAAVLMADRLGIALAGFTRDPGFTLYTHPERVLFAAPFQEPCYDAEATAAGMVPAG